MKKAKDLSVKHEGMESMADEAKETRLEKKGYVETKSGKMKKPKKNLGGLIGLGADKLLKDSEGARSFTKNLGLAGKLLGQYYDKKADSKDKTTGAKQTTQVVAKRKGGKVKKLVYGGVSSPVNDGAQAYSSFAQQAPVMEAPVMDAGMSDPMSGYKDGGSVNIGKGKDYIKDLL
jgi:hypothetical protein